MRLRLNAVVGSVVVTLGFWMMWGELPPAATAVLAVVIALVLGWRSDSVAAVWGWVTALLGLESLAWPILTMVSIRMATASPTDQQMGEMLTAILFGLFSSIFWLTFSYGIFKKLRAGTDQSGKNQSART